MRSSRRICWVLATTIAVAITSPIAIAQPTSYVRPGSEDAATTTAGVQPGSGFSVGDVVGDVVTAGSYSSTTLTAATTAGESSGEGDTTGVSAATTTPLLFAMVAACVVVVGAIAIVTKRAEKRVPSPHTPVDKAIYFQVQVKKPGFFHVNRQLTPPMTGSTIV
ncbi:hypothetical protein PRIC2_013342 [Phytophthora ramorum]